jgi:hypothetical protein
MLCAAPLLLQQRAFCAGKVCAERRGRVTDPARVGSEPDQLLGEEEPMSSPYQRSQVSSRQRELEARAQQMRRHQTPSEERLWSALRSGRLGVAFRRRVVIDRFVVDFAANQARVVVEADGGVHRTVRGSMRDGTRISCGRATT